jgi:hypothetical protein
VFLWGCRQEIYLVTDNYFGAVGTFREKEFLVLNNRLAGITDKVTCHEYTLSLSILLAKVADVETRSASVRRWIG